MSIKFDDMSTDIIDIFTWYCVDTIKEILESRTPTLEEFVKGLSCFSSLLWTERLNRFLTDSATAFHLINIFPLLDFFQTVEVSPREKCSIYLQNHCGIERIMKGSFLRCALMERDAARLWRQAEEQIPRRRSKALPFSSVLSLHLLHFAATVNDSWPTSLFCCAANAKVNKYYNSCQ